MVAAGGKLSSGTGGVPAHLVIWSAKRATPAPTTRRGRTGAIRANSSGVSTAGWTRVSTRSGWNAYIAPYTRPRSASKQAATGSAPRRTAAAAAAALDDRDA